MEQNGKGEIGPLIPPPPGAKYRWVWPTSLIAAGLLILVLVPILGGGGGLQEIRGNEYIPSIDPDDTKSFYLFVREGEIVESYVLVNGETDRVDVGILKPGEMSAVVIGTATAEDPKLVISADRGTGVYEIIFTNRHSSRAIDISYVWVILQSIRLPLAITNVALPIGAFLIGVGAPLGYNYLRVRFRGESAVKS